MLLTKLAGTLLKAKALPAPRKVLEILPNMAVKPITKMPFFLQKSILSQLLFRVFEENLAEGELDFLRDHWLEIDILDAEFTLQFSCGEKREVLLRKHGKADACIRGNLKSFAFLAARKEDPDTLFFQRDLVIEGDTNIGLEVKNMLDSLDLEQLPPELRFGIRCGGEYMDAFC